MFTSLTETVMGDAVLWCLSFLVLAIILRLAFKSGAPIWLLLTLALYLAIGAGVTHTLVLIFFMLSARFVGRALYMRLALTNNQIAPLEQSAILGSACYLFTWGLLIDFPLNYPVVHTLLIFAPAIIDLVLHRKNLLPALVAGLRSLQARLQAFPFWQLVLTLMMVGWVLRYTFFPTVGHDDNVFHLRLWTELLHHRYFDYDLQNEIWSLAPNLVDVTHAVFSLVAGEDARSAMNLVMGSVLCLEVLSLLRLLQAKPGTQMLILVLIVSTPLFAYQLTSLQTELALALFLIVGTNIALRLKSLNDTTNILALAAIGALAIATKLPGAFVALSIFLVSAAQIALYGNHLALQMPARPFRLFLVLFGLIALACLPYARAYLVTGNPFFPLMNGIFKSLYFDPVNFVDFRYVHELSIATYWDIFVNTSQYNETQDYTAGMQYLFLAPLALLIALVRFRRTPYALLAVPVIVYGGTMFSQTQYLRYFFPIMPLLSVAIAQLITLPTRWLRLLIKGIIVVCISVNFFMVPKASWFMNRPTGNLLTIQGKQLAYNQIVPERALNDFVNKQHPGASVLYVSRPYGATLNGKPITVNWHSPKNHAAFKTLKSDEDLLQFLENLQPDFIVRRTEESTKDWQRLPLSLVREHLVGYGYPVFMHGNAILYRRTANFILYTDARSQDPTKKLIGIRKSAPYSLSESHMPFTDTFSTDGKSYLKVSLILDCQNQGSSMFSLQLSWDTDEIYSSLIKCNDEVLVFNETMPIPPAATLGKVSISAASNQKVTVEHLNIGLN